MIEYRIIKPIPRPGATIMPTKRWLPLTNLVGCMSMGVVVQLIAKGAMELRDTERRQDGSRT